MPPPDRVLFPVVEARLSPLHPNTETSPTGLHGDALGLDGHTSVDVPVELDLMFPGAGQTIPDDPPSGRLISQAAPVHHSRPRSVAIVAGQQRHRPLGLHDSAMQRGGVWARPEERRFLNRLIQSIKEHRGVRAAVSLNPATSLSVLDYVLADVDMVLIMSVNPGFGGQAFIPAALDKIAWLRKRIDGLGLKTEIEVDGGVKPSNAAEIIRAGADILVAGSAVFGARDYAAAIKGIRGE